MQIAVIDDEPVSLAVMSGLVAKVARCQVHEFGNANAALTWCADHEPDLVIVDYMMPTIDGIEFTRKLRSLSARRKTPVVMVSAVVDRDLIRRALEQGVDDFLHKPFDYVELRTCVSNVLGLRAMQDQLANKALLMEARSQSHDASRLRIAQLLDLKMTQARLGGDENLVAEIAHVFVQTVPQLMNAIRASLSNDDFDTIRERVTALKGAIAAVEAPVVSHLLADIELHARTRNRSATAVAFGMAQALVDRLVIELAMYSTRDSATSAESGEQRSVTNFC